MENKVKDLMIRYGLMIILALLIPFYQLVLLPLTIYPVHLMLSMFYDITLIESSLFTEHVRIDIITACIGVAAVFLLMLLNLATPSIKLKKRFKLFLITLAAFLVFNWLRIFILSVLFIEGAILFNQLHIFSWYVVSTLAVALIWIITTKYFNIKDIPLLSDIEYLRKHIKK